MKDKPYREVIGTMAHTANYGRIDFLHAVYLLSRFQDNPILKHWKGVEHIMKCLRDNDDWGMTIGGPHEDEKLIGYTDASFAEENESRRSTTGYVWLVYGSPVYFKSSK